jgi:hypothetical protein
MLGVARAAAKLLIFTHPTCHIESNLGRQRRNFFRDLRSAIRDPRSLCVFLVDDRSEIRKTLDLDLDLDFVPATSRCFVPPSLFNL